MGEGEFPCSRPFLYIDLAVWLEKEASKDYLEFYSERVEDLKYTILKMRKRQKLISLDQRQMKQLCCKSLAEFNTYTKHNLFCGSGSPHAAESGSQGEDAHETSPIPEDEEAAFETYELAMSKALLTYKADLKGIRQACQQLAVSS